MASATSPGMTAYPPPTANPPPVRRPQRAAVAGDVAGAAGYASLPSSRKVSAASSSPAFRRATTARARQFTAAAMRKKQVNEQIPGVLPYVLLGAAVVSSLVMPLYVFFYGGARRPETTGAPTSEKTKNEARGTTL